MAWLQARKFAAKDGTVVTIASPGIGDAAELTELVRYIMAKSEHLHTQADEFTITQEQQEKRIQTLLDHPDYLIIVANVDGKIVGTLDFLCGKQRKIAHHGSFGMSIHPEFQGMGIGRAMLESLLEWATANPRLETVRLQVHSKNERALALYRSVGFREEGRELDGVKVGDEEYDHVILMSKTLSAPKVI